MSNYDPNQKRGGPANAGNWTAYENSDPEGPTTPPVAAPVLPEAPYWANGGFQHGTQITESPVSDRDRNYHLTFEPDGYVEVNPFEFGIDDPEHEASNDLDRVYVGVSDDGEHLDVQYTDQTDDMRDLRDIVDNIDDLPEETMAAVEAAIAADLKETYGDAVSVEFTTSADRWDDVSISYKKSFEAEREPDGRLTATTSNIMVALEEDPNYQSIRNGYAEAAIYKALRDHNVEYA